MNDARGKELHIGDTIVTTDRNGAGDPVLTQHIVHGFDGAAGNVICGLTYREIHKRTPGSRTGVSPVQINSREKVRYALAANTVHRKSEY